MNTACPLVMGENDRSTSSTWPDSVSGRVVMKNQWTGLEGEDLLCLETTVKVVGSALRRRWNFNGTLLRDDISQKRITQIYSVSAKNMFPVCYRYVWGSVWQNLEQS